jgi:histone acetyltransferase (RNA polymerase elongator complex component)
MRAAKHEFDCVGQIHNRMDTLYTIGNDVFKLEVNVLGGTFTSYPNEYREEFVRDIYYAANTFWNSPRNRLSLQEEKNINETAKSRVVLIAVEIRPDSVTIDEIKFLRYLSITRIQMGIQHLDDEILKKLNRKCTTARTIQAIEMLRRHGFKIDAHIMFNLPFSSPEKDRKMAIDKFCGLKKPIKREIKKETWLEWLMGHKKIEHWEYYDLKNPEIICDQYKLYPCAVLIHTEIEKWYKEGFYVPYDEHYLKDILLDFKRLVFPFIRINRIMRDFYETNIFSISGTNLQMRSELSDILKKDGGKCNCIRCREIKDKPWDGNYIIVIRKHFAGNGDEYFISAESKDYNTLYGFARLRLDDAKDKIFEELNGAALLRELHVYANVTEIGKKGIVQHRGLGSKLMKKAEEIAKEYKYIKMAVIASVGSRSFYQKIGYTLDPRSGEYMMKNLMKIINHNKQIY